MPFLMLVFAHLHVSVEKKVAGGDRTVIEEFQIVSETARTTIKNEISGFQKGGEIGGAERENHSNAVFLLWEAPTTIKMLKVHILIVEKLCCHCGRLLLWS